MISGLFGAFSMVATIIGVAEGETLDVCFQKSPGCNCISQLPVPTFNIPRPGFCQCKLNKGLILGGGIPAILCITAALIICVYHACKAKRILWTVIHSCCAQLALLIFFLCDVHFPKTIGLNFLVDWFLIVSWSSLLVEAVATCLFIRDKSLSTKLGTLIVGICCWGIPLLKSIIVFAVHGSEITSKCQEYFMLSITSLHITNIVVIALLVIAIVVAIVVAIVFLREESKTKDEERCDVWRRIWQCLATWACFCGWTIALLVLGTCLPFDIVFIVFVLLQGLVILGFCCYVVFKPCGANDECDSGHRSPSVSPEFDGDEKKSGNAPETFPFRETDSAASTNDGAGKPPPKAV